VRALVTGAAGFLGACLSRRLVAEGHAVRALVRPGGAPDALAGLDVEVVRGDVTDPGSLPAAVRGVDVVFHLAGVRRAPRREEFLRVNVAGTRLLLEACAAHAPGLARFVLAGSIAATGPSAAGRREEDPLAPVEAYGESKAEAERIAFSFADVEDCARGMALLATRPEAVGQAFFLASPERTSVEGLQREVARALGEQPRLVRIPPAALRALGTLADVASRALGRHLPLNRKLAEQVLAPGWVCETDKARRMLGFEAEVGLATSIDRSARWYLDAGLL
jgi:nucleoside-diphosphate-sugar epimerase